MSHDAKVNHAERKACTRLEKNKENPKQMEIDAAWRIYLKPEENEAEARRRWLTFYIEHQNGKCAYCGISVQFGKIPGLEDRQETIDHIVPRSAKGEDSPRNTLAACAFCNGAKSNFELGHFILSAKLRDRVLQISECPDRVSADPTSKYFDGDSIARGIRVIVDGKEFLNVHEYCLTEGWVKLRLPKVKTRTGQPMTALRRGDVSRCAIPADSNGKREIPR